MQKNSILNKFTFVAVIEVEIDEKSFGNWSMGFRNLENVDITMLEDFNSFLLSNDINDVVSISPLIM